MVWVWHKGGVGGPWFDDRRRVAGATGSGGIGGISLEYVPRDPQTVQVIHIIKSLCARPYLQNNKQ